MVEMKRRRVFGCAFSKFLHIVIADGEDGRRGSFHHMRLVGTIMPGLRLIKPSWTCISDISTHVFGVIPFFRFLSFQDLLKRAGHIGGLLKRGRRHREGVQIASALSTVPGTDEFGCLQW